MDTASTLALVGFVAACLAAASTGAVFKPGAWYARLRKPSFNPPDWLFPIAWAVLFLMIAVSGWLVWRVTGFGAEVALWFGSLLLNSAWSWLFFGRRRMDLALAELAVFWVSILAMILAFAPVSAAAAWLLVPYLVWVSFAGVLNWTLWRLNPAENGAADDAAPAGATPPRQAAE